MGGHFQGNHPLGTRENTLQCARTDVHMEGARRRSAKGKVLYAQRQSGSRTIDCWLGCCSRLGQKTCLMNTRGIHLTRTTHECHTPQQTTHRNSALPVDPCHYPQYTGARKGRLWIACEGGTEKFGWSTPELVRTILLAIQKSILGRRSASSVKIESVGPTAENQEPWQVPEHEHHWDDMNGGFLNPEVTEV